MKSVPIVLVLAALAACEDRAEAPLELAPLTLPVASQGVVDQGDDPDDRLVISIDAKGYVHFKGRKTLEELGAALAREKVNYDLKMRAKGKSGLEDLRGGAKASKLYVLLRANKETPWQHVLWLMVIMAEQKFYKLQFGVSRDADRAYTKAEAAGLGAEWVDRAPPAAEKPHLAAKLDSFLPRDEVLPIPREPPNEIRVAVHIVARKEVAAKWGPDALPVSKPSAFKYRLGNRTFDTLEHVRKQIGNATKAAQGARNTKVIGEIQAGHKVPFKQIVAVLNEFHGRDVKQVDFWLGFAERDEAFRRTAIPGMDVRKLPSLPYPLKNYPTPR